MGGSEGLTGLQISLPQPCPARVAATSLAGVQARATSAFGPLY